jgi:hypothetical protein
MGLYGKSNGTHKRNAQKGKVKPLSFAERQARLTHLEQLNIELMDNLELCMLCTKDFCEKNNIPFYDEKILGLIKKTKVLIDEIDPLPFARHTKLADGFLRRKRTDTDLTEPVFGFW